MEAGTSGHPSTRFGIAVRLTDRGIRPQVLGRMVEDFGFESLFLPEHTHVPVDPSGPDVPDDFGRFMDPLECLAAIASVTSNLVLGTGVLVLPNHDPIVLAKRISTLDHITGGRLVVGLGAGSNAAELTNHGGDPTRRWGSLLEHLAAMRAIWANEVASYQGEHVRFGPLVQWPKPFQPPHPPLFLGGSGPAIEKRLVAQRCGWTATGLHLKGEALAERIDSLQKRAAEAGIDPVPVMLQAATPAPDAIEAYVAMGLVRCTFTLTGRDEEETRADLDRLRTLVEPYAG